MSIFSFIIIFYFFLKVKYFKCDGLINVIKYNIFQIIFVLLGYMVFIKDVSEMLFLSFKTYIESANLVFYPEKYFLILPASIGSLLFFYRLLSNPDIISHFERNKKWNKTILIYLSFIRFQADDLERIRNIIFSLLMGTVVISLIGFFVLDIDVKSTIGEELYASLRKYSQDY